MIIQKYNIKYLFFESLKSRKSFIKFSFLLINLFFLVINIVLPIYIFQIKERVRAIDILIISKILIMIFSILFLLFIYLFCPYFVQSFMKNNIFFIIANFLMVISFILSFMFFQILSNKPNLTRDNIENLRIYIKENLKAFNSIIIFFLINFFIIIILSLFPIIQSTKTILFIFLIFYTIIFSLSSFYFIVKQL